MVQLVAALLVTDHHLQEAGGVIVDGFLRMDSSIRNVDGSLYSTFHCALRVLCFL